VFPDAVPASGPSQPGSVLDDILKGTPGGAPAPSSSVSPLDQLLNQPPTTTPTPDSDPILERLRRGN